MKLGPGISLSYSGGFYPNARLKVMVPATLLIIFVLPYLIFRRADEVPLIMTTLPFALTGSIWFLYQLGYNFSVATGIGIIALAGVATQIGIIMLLYLKQALRDCEDQGLTPPQA